MVKLELNLPWKPVLAWPWGVRYLVDPATCLVTDHIESWDIAPLEVSALRGRSEAWRSCAIAGRRPLTPSALVCLACSSSGRQANLSAAHRHHS
jgi:hypothetical protein